MAISSYGAATDSSGVVRILKDLDINIAGRDVLVVEDIIDSGLTLSYLMRNLQARKPASLEICALLTKPERREIDVPVRYVGFEIPNRFVIGYGLDFAERYRNLPYIGVLHPDLSPRGPAGGVRPVDADDGPVAAQTTLLPSRVPVNRFFRSALFPLVVIVLLVYLASQTLIPKRDNAAQAHATRELITQAQSGERQRGQVQPEPPVDQRHARPRAEGQGQLPDGAVADPVPEHPREEQRQVRLQGHGHLDVGGRSSPGCCRSCS